MLADLYKKYLESGNVCTDTRKIIPNSIFFALKGENFNANEFALQALEKGAKYAVVDEKKYATHERSILVPNVLQTLQQLARHHRDQLNIPVIGLTGSNGKTTSKELLNAVLSKKYKTLATKGNLNNHIGVPLTLLGIDTSIEIAIIEMGANHVGEIALLSSIANPTHGFITNIGKAHIGTFGGFENIIRGKSELYHHLITTNGTVFINSQNEILANMAKRFTSPIFYPAEADFYRCEFISADPYVKVKAENGQVIETKLVGKYNFENIATALCIGKYFEVDANDANNAVATYTPENMRSQIVKKGTNTIILDAYNANPSSMKVAIDSLADMRVERKVLILGDMFELETESDKEHQHLGQLILDRDFSDVYLCGKLVAKTKEIIPFAKHFERKEDLINELKTNPIQNATILIKASRGIGLETIVDSL